MSEISTRVAELSQRVEDLKVPPHSLEAEQSVIGGLMLDNRAWDEVADVINENDFYRHDHALILRAIDALAEDSQRVEDLKVPPHSLEAEQSVIGGLMLDNRAWDANHKLLGYTVKISALKGCHRLAAFFCAERRQGIPLSTQTVYDWHSMTKTSCNQRV